MNVQYRGFDGNPPHAISFKMLLGVSDSAVLTEHVLQALELVDITMIANFIWLIIAGSYYVFIDNTYPGTTGKCSLP